MLSFFPRPYPGEWLYSVLCRYHVRTGNSKHQTTVTELFQGREHAAIAALYPNGIPRQLTSQLPPDYLSVDELAIGHTLLPFFTRFSSESKKREAQDRVRLGETVVVASVRRFSGMANWTPRFCSECVAADRQRYGEAYWHVSHQISMMTVCPDHGCRLMTLPSVDTSHLKYSFYSLEGQPIEESEPVPSHGAEWELTLSQILAEYQSLPFLLSPPPHNNLAITLANRGYGVIQSSSPNTILDAKRLYRELREFFGVALVEQYFGGEGSIWQLNRLAKWELETPERFALLQTFAGVDSEQIFSPTVAEDKYEVAIRELVKSDVTVGRADAAKQLGVTISQLEILVKKYGIRPFWREGGEKMSESITAHFTPSEVERITEAVRRGEAQNLSDFLRKCVREHFERV